MAKQPPAVGSSPDRGAPPASADTAPAPQQDDKQAQRFYERLEQAGQLVDVDETTDLSTLPSRVTHVRFPNGIVKRIQFS
jgi:hypothetical protein